MKKNHNDLYSTEILFTFIHLVKIICTKETRGSKITPSANQPTNKPIKKTRFSVDL